MSTRAKILIITGVVISVVLVIVLVFLLVWFLVRKPDSSPLYSGESLYAQVCSSRRRTPSPQLRVHMLHNYGVDWKGRMHLECFRRFHFLELIESYPMILYIYEIMLNVFGQQLSRAVKLWLCQ